MAHNCNKLPLVNLQGDSAERVDLVITHFISLPDMLQLYDWLQTAFTFLMVDDIIALSSLRCLCVSSFCDASNKVSRSLIRSPVKDANGAWPCWMRLNISNGNVSCLPITLCIMRMFCSID